MGRQVDEASRAEALEHARPVGLPVDQRHDAVQVGHPPDLQPRAGQVGQAAVEVVVEAADDQRRTVGQRPGRPAQHGRHRGQVGHHPPVGEDAAGEGQGVERQHGESAVGHDDHVVVGRELVGDRAEQRRRELGADRELGGELCGLRTARW